VLEDAPYSFLATAYAAPAAEKAVFDAVSRQFPGVAVVFLREVLDVISEFVGRIGLAFRSVAAVALVAGLLVLAEALRATWRCAARGGGVQGQGATRGTITRRPGPGVRLQGGMPPWPRPAWAPPRLGLSRGVEAPWVFLPLPLAGAGTGPGRGPGLAWPGCAARLPLRLGLLRNE
jgi:putative ABC transport system permease protein